MQGIQRFFVLGAATVLVLVAGVMAIAANAANVATGENVRIPDASVNSAVKYYVAVSIRGKVDFDQTIVPVASDVWILLGQTDVAVAFLDSPEQLVILGSHGEANVHMAGVEPEDVLSLLQDSVNMMPTSGHQGGVVLPNCGHGQHLCYCPVSAEQACGPAPFSSHKCCDDDKVCQCDYASPPGEECISAVRASCTGVGGVDP